MFILSASALLQGLISQNLLTARVYEIRCSFKEVSNFFSVFLITFIKATILQKLMLIVTLELRIM